VPWWLLLVEELCFSKRVFGFTKGLVWKSTVAGKPWDLRARKNQDLGVTL
jgi:hypothetical protein